MAILTFPASASRHYVILSIGTAVTVVLLAWAMRGVSIAAVGQALQRADWAWLLLGWLAYLVSYVLRAWRWRFLLGEAAQGPFRTYLAATFIGFGASSFLPSYSGEVIRAMIPARLNQVAFEAAFGSIFAERLLDLGVVFLFLLLPYSLGALPDSALNAVSLSWIGAAIMLIWILMVVAVSLPQLLLQIAVNLCRQLKLQRFQSQVSNGLAQFLQGLQALTQPRRSLMALIATVAIWGLNAITYWAGLLAFKITAPGFLGALFTQSATALAIILPATPGNIGPFEASLRFSLSLYGVSSDSTIAYALALRFLMYVTIPCIALILVACLGWSRKELIALTRINFNSK